MVCACVLFGVLTSRALALSRANDTCDLNLLSSALAFPTSSAREDASARSLYHKLVGWLAMIHWSIIDRSAASSAAVARCMGVPNSSRREHSLKQEYWVITYEKWGWKTKQSKEGKEATQMTVNWRDERKQHRPREIRGQVPAGDADRRPNRNARPVE